MLGAMLETKKLFMLLRPFKLEKSIFDLLSLNECLFIFSRSTDLIIRYSYNMYLVNV